MMKLLLARHGETDWNAAGLIQGQTDTVLNANGRGQAAQLACRLRQQGETVSALYTSPQERAFETACIVGKDLGLTPVPIDDLCEINFGIWEGHSWGEVKAGWPEEFAAYNGDRLAYCPPGGESYANLLARVRPVLNRFMQEGVGTALVISHSAVIKSLCCLRDGVSFTEISRRYPLGNADWVAMEGAI